MSINVPRWRFTQLMIQDAPDWKGVYVLWSRGVPLAVGHARGGDDSIRSRLLAHYSRAASAGMANVTHYSWEICSDPLKREAELVEELGLARRAPVEQRDTSPSEKAAWIARESS
ncbi:MAG: hypothetical protein JO292_09165 [Betaproteobacteria bacterium]|nr:hypothetical protein [Betaproteobacteria bacterium]MBV9361551.1 hypothetical protein [Betaproteobacteria bacterium]